MGKTNNGSFRVKYPPDKPRPCVRCRKVLPPESFFAKLRNPDGSVRTRGSICRDCNRELQRERTGAKPKPQAMSPEQVRERNRELYRQRMADPVKRERILATVRKSKQAKREAMLRDAALHEAHLADERIRQRLAKPTTILRPAVGGYDADSREWVDAQPMLDFLDAAFGAIEPRDLAVMLKVESHRITHLREQKRVSISVVDHVLTAGLGRPDLLNALYPMEGAA